MQLMSGEQVRDRPRSHVHSDARELLPEALSQISADGRDFFVEVVDFGRLIGETTCVETGPGDEIVMARRVRRAGYTRFVKGRTPQPSTTLVVVLKAGDGGEYIIISAFVGQKAEPECWDRNATENSGAFWSSHALVWGFEQVVPGTECPELNLFRLKTALEYTRKTVDFKVGERVFQMSGHPQLTCSGCWERFFAEGLQPYRKEVGLTGTMAALLSGASFRIYSVDYDDGEELSRPELTAWVEMTWKQIRGE